MLDREREGERERERISDGGKKQTFAKTALAS